MKSPPVLSSPQGGKSQPHPPQSTTAIHDLPTWIRPCVTPMTPRYTKAFLTICSLFERKLSIPAAFPLNSPRQNQHGPTSKVFGDPVFVDPPSGLRVNRNQGTGTEGVDDQGDPKSAVLIRLCQSVFSGL